MAFPQRFRARSTQFGGRRPSDMKHYLPQPIRCRRPPFLLRVHPGASAVPSIALACREYAPMTQATSFPPSSLQTWQHAADVVGRLHGSHSNRRRFGAVRSLADVLAWTLCSGGEAMASCRLPQSRVVLHDARPFLRQHGDAQWRGKWCSGGWWTMEAGGEG